jgi:hypothetical protein
MGQPYVIERAERVTAILQMAHSLTSGQKRMSLAWLTPTVVEYGMHR